MERTNKCTRDGDADCADLQRELRALQQQLREATAVVSKAHGLRDAQRLAEAASVQRLTYPGDTDDGLARLGARLEKMCEDVEALVRGDGKRRAEHEQQLEKRRQQRRMSAVITEEAMREPEPPLDYDTDETVDELVGFDAERVFAADDKNKTEPSPAPVSADSTRSCDVLSVSEAPEEKPALEVSKPWKPVEKLAREDVEPFKPVVEADRLAVQVAKCLRLAEDSASLSWSEDTTYTLAAVLETVKDAIIAADAAHSYRRLRKPRGRIAREVLASLADAVKIAMDNLLQIDMTTGLVQPVLRLHETLRQARHPQLKKTSGSAILVLDRVVARLAETVGCVKPSRRGNPRRDATARRCFAVAIDLLTTTSERRRALLVDDVLRTLRSGFTPRVVLRQAKKATRLQRTSGAAEEATNNDKWVVTWAGRVMLLAANMAAYVLATQMPPNCGRFLHAVERLRGRDASFSPLFDRTRAILLKSPSPGHLELPLDLKREARRVHEACARVCGRG